ncbi:hypothetical protein SARC_04442 [Sphaeroforma arctica JP610]|uniref:Apple domain-containing protein n=1 Tax=Sphaeroforma arctica JP610 TaxID=667725 RepID=A0A0L0G4V4_9EUKA|nr:hypothetical protein SARC_04442 [Sphaeroforma arctica JP610]KNC83298.1 hypothetical protein SARC_04442 [Sphaeroforma arctica JP610]|eukprot:XP_014157200.1 hypothetical protein SARC_04442 [Sphaeroforma arctica JP610]
MLRGHTLVLAVCASLLASRHVHGVAVDMVVLGPSNAEEWKAYYGDLLSTAGEIEVSGYSPIGEFNELFEVVERDIAVSVEYLAGNTNFTSLQRYADACVAACEENRIQCGSFAFSYLEFTPANNACLLMKKSDPFTLLGFQCDGFCPVSETAIMMQVLIQTPTPTCGFDRYYGYKVAAELATEIFDLGCQDTIEDGGTCGDIGYSGADMTNDNYGCAMDSICYYLKADGVSKCLSQSSVDEIIREDLATEKEEEKHAHELLYGFQEMLKNVTVPEYRVPYWTVMAIASLDDSSYRSDGEFTNYEQSIEWFSLSGIGNVTVEEYARTCANACSDFNYTAGEVCKGFGYVFKPDAVEENQCRLFPQEIEFNFLGYGCGNNYCPVGNGIMLKLYFSEKIDCGEGRFHGYDLQQFSYEGDRLENFICRDQWGVNGYCGADAFTPSTDLSYNNSGCPIVTECELDDNSGYYYCRLGDMVPTFECGEINGMEYNVYLGELSSITSHLDDTFIELVDEGTNESLPVRFHRCTEHCAANRPCQSWALLSDLKTCFMTNYHITQLPKQILEDITPEALMSKAVLGYFVDVRNDPIVLPIPFEDDQTGFTSAVHTTLGSATNSAIPTTVVDNTVVTTQQ